jgi:hypothetical protein
MEIYKEEKNCIVERENAFFKSSPVDEYHLRQMNSEKVFFGCSDIVSVFRLCVIVTHVLNLFEMREKSVHYLGIELSTSGVVIDYVSHYTI